MEHSENTHTDRELWEDGMEDIFIEILYWNALTGALQARKITSSDHRLYAQHLTVVDRRVFDSNQMKGKIQG